MSNYEQLVKALRHCSGTPYARCSNCPMHDKGVADYATPCGILSDAAAAIESLNRLLDQNTQRCESLRKQLREAHESYERHLNDLEAQLPKLGEWIWDDKRCIYVCSVCGSPKVRENMDRQTIKEQAYCYSCGAKMTGEQDVE